MTVRDAHVGTWRLVDWVITDRQDGDVYPYGPNANGVIILTDDGHMSAHLRNPDADLSDLAGGSPDDVIGVLSTAYFGYHGPYTVDHETATITITVEGALSPAWIGSTQLRTLAIDSNGRMTLSSYSDDPTSVAAGADGNNILTWERASQ